MKAKLFVSLLMFFATATVVSAQPIGGERYYPGARPSMTQRAPIASAEKLLREGVAKLVAFMEAGGTGDEKKTLAFLNAKIAPYFDFAHMAKWVAGSRYRRMNERGKHHNKVVVAVARELVGFLWATLVTDEPTAA